MAVSNLSDFTVIIPEESHLSSGIHQSNGVNKTIKDQRNYKGKIRSHRNESDKSEISSLRPRSLKDDKLRLNRRTQTQCSKPVVLNGESPEINLNKKFDADVNLKNVSMVSVLRYVRAVFFYF